MNNSKESIKSFYKKSESLSSYLSEHDKYLSLKVKPEFKLNVIGAGNIGKEHIHVTMLEGRAVVNGIYDVDKKSCDHTKELFLSEYPNNDLEIYDTLKAACNDPEVDGLIICTPNYTHYEVIKEAVKSKKHILLEKPMASNMKDAKKIMEIAQEYESILQIGLQYRYKPIYVEAIHEALERKTIGDVKTMTILEHRIPFLDKVGQWNKFSRLSGGTLIEKCCHYFDLFNLFAQSKPLEVYATGSASVNFKSFEYDGNNSDIIDNAFVNITYENDLRANFNLCMFSPMFYEELVLCGNEGRLKASETEEFVENMKQRNYLEIIRVDGAPSKTMNPEYPVEIAESGHGGSSYYEHSYFIDNMKGKEIQTVTAEEGFWSIVIGSAAEESIKTGKVVNIAEHLQAHQIYM